MNKLLVIVALVLLATSSAYAQFSCPAKTRDSMIQQFKRSGCELGTDVDKYVPDSNCHRDVPSAVINAVNQLYPERQKVVDQLISDKISFVPKANGKAYITFFKTGAGYKNRLGLYYYQGSQRVEQPIVFPFVNTFSNDCLDPGNTAIVDVVKDRKYGFLLYSNYWNGGNIKIYSDVTMGTPHGHDLTTSDKKGHVTWVEISGEDSIVFGFEDKVSGSDYDYNDIVFTLHLDVDADYNDLPIYEDGHVKQCIPLDTVTSSSYVEESCFSWALLEKEETNACNFYLKPPTGWIIPKRSELTESVIEKVTKWEHDCFGVLDDNNEPIFIDRNGNECEGIEYSETEGCYAVDCSYRFIIRSENEHELCGGGYDFCDPDASKLVSTYPREDQGWIVFPNVINSFLLEEKPLNLNIDVSMDPDAPSVDVVVAFDLEGTTDDQVKNIRDNFNKVFDRLDGLNYRVAAAGVHSSSFSVTNFYDKDSKDKIEDQLKGVISKKQGNSDLITLVTNASKCPQCAWRQESSTVRVIVFVTNKKPTSSVSNNDVKKVLDNNNILIFIGGKQGNGQDWNNFAGNFKNSASYFPNDSNFKEYTKGISSQVRAVIKRSYIHTVSGADFVNSGSDELKSLSSEGETNHVVQVEVDSSNIDKLKNSNEVILNLLGRSKTVVYINTNRPPVANDVSINFELGDFDVEYQILYSLVASDPDQGKLKYKLVNSPDTIEVRQGGSEVGDEYFENPNIDIRVTPSEYPYSEVLEFAVSDGCAEVTFSVTVIASCSIGGGEDTPSDLCYIPKCNDINLIATRGERLDITLSGYYDTYDDYSGLNRRVKSISGPSQSNFFENTNLSDGVEVGEDVDENIYFFAGNVNSMGGDEYILKYTVYNNRFPYSSNLPQSDCQVKVTVKPANIPPEYNGQKVFNIDEDSFLTFFIDDNDVTFEVPDIIVPPGQSRLQVKVDPGFDKLCGDSNSDEDKYGCVKCCYGSDCSGENCLEESVTVPTFSFTPYPNDYDDNYIVIPIVISDRMQSEPVPGRFDVTVNVKPVNDAPVLVVNEGIKVLGGEGESNGVNTIKKGEEFVFSWKVYDIDNLPNQLVTNVFANSLTKNPWVAYACVNGEEDCSQLIDLSPSTNINFNVQKRVKCGSAAELKNQRGEGLEECYAEFTLRFVPQNSQVPYIIFTLTGSDQQPFNGFSNSVRIQVNVEPVNLPPTVWSPPKIESTTSLVNLRIGNQTVNVTDDGPAFWEVTLTMTSVSENGHFVIPNLATNKCEDSEDDEYSVVCKDTVININNWIKELRYNITNGDKSANVSFVVEDNGFPGIVGGSLESDIVYTHITIDDTIIPDVPKSSSKLLIIALSVGAAGAIALGVAVAVLRNKLSPPSDDYFQIGTDTVSTSPQSPLYQGQTKEGFSGLYSGAKA